MLRAGWIFFHCCAARTLAHRREKRMSAQNVSNSLFNYILYLPRANLSFKTKLLFIRTCLYILFTVFYVYAVGICRTRSL